MASSSEQNPAQNQRPSDGGNASAPENAHGVGSQQQGQHDQTKPANDSEGHHGGNHGNDANDAGQPNYSAKGSSKQGAGLDAESKNSGGGSDREHQNQPQNTTDSGTDYHDGNAAPSPANDGGKIGDANNPV